MRTRLRTWLDRLMMRLDERFRDAHREPAPHPAECTCDRCDLTEPEPPCEHPASLRYQLKGLGLTEWYCGSCGENSEAPAVLPDPRPVSPPWRSSTARPDRDTFPGDD